MGSKPQALAAPAQPSAGALDRAEHHLGTTAPMGSKPQALAAPTQPSAAPRQGALDRAEHHRGTTARTSRSTPPGR